MKNESSKMPRYLINRLERFPVHFLYLRPR